MHGFENVVLHVVLNLVIYIYLQCFIPRQIYQWIRSLDMRINLTLGIRMTQYLWQQLSISIQRGNAVPHIDGLACPLCIIMYIGFL